jgi:hypothetical protein
MSNGFPFIPEQNFFFKTFFAIFKQDVENKHQAVSEGARRIGKRSMSAEM